MLGRFYFFIAMRKKTQRGTANKVKLETNIPNLEINPTVIGATENDNRIEWVEETLKVLFELSGVEETFEDFLNERHIKKATLEDWTEFYFDERNWTRADLVFQFLVKYYDWKYAYLRTPSWEDIYWRISIGDEWEMHTEKWILTMPLVKVGGKNVFFPVSAILTPEEQSLYEMYKQYATSVSEKDSIEKQIMDLMIRLSTISTEDIVESNNFMKEIIDYCEHSWTVQKLSLNNGKVYLDFGWRYWKDTDWAGEDYITLPPCQLIIDIPNHIVKGWECYHPHILWWHSLCMGWTLSDMVNTCLNEKSMKWLVECMVQFANSYTSSDCGLQNDDRSPAGCLKRYCYEASCRWDEVDYANLPVRFEDIMKTAIKYWNRPRESFWNGFKNSLRDYFLLGKWQEMIDIIKEKYWMDRALSMLRFCGNSSAYTEAVLNNYWIDLSSNE